MAEFGKTATEIPNPTAQDQKPDSISIGTMTAGSMEEKDAVYVCELYGAGDPD